MLDPSGASLSWLEGKGVQVTRGRPTWEGKFFSEDELVARSQGFPALMGASTHKITRRVMEALPDLAFVSKYGIGVDSIEMAAANDLGILVTNTPVPENWEAVAEYTIAAMLALKKQLLFYTADRIKSGGWRTETKWSTFMRGNTIGLVGLGRIARSVALRLSGWDCQIIACDPYVSASDAHSLGIELVSLQDLLKRSDVVSLHCLLTAETKHMIDARALRMMKESAVLINSARGGLVDMDALDSALAEGRVAGTAMDSYEDEPPTVGHPIFERANVIATPHTSAWIEETYDAIARAGALNIHAALLGDTPPFPVNLEVL
ncbi:MAG TPA: NAD(P)-dependent oxidoreductase [Nocardioides sp.]|uniref:NAD(P)-dependent oxidoreductase n=1 Tax=uncultured Nocardioides sp. TaxID=198441 RepID=UPI00260E400C|nr:NAD(P)-dependent oxidoreductase [uncultured Nocardioides sp.]HRI94038.1 NAD(P)-dependent oxidoreductase [Nocardioides sp.]HRK44054.1 NAD(P)-dependent oxidoreductase [Nocardioides sp.]